MDKLKKLIEHNIFVKVFGIGGIFIAICYFLFTTILQTEISTLWDKYVHSSYKMTLSEKKTAEIKPTDTVMPMKKAEKSDQKENIKVFDKIEGIMEAEGECKKNFIPAQSGVYGFHFEIDDVNKEYYFYIYDSKGNWIDEGNSSYDNASAFLEKGEEYTFVISSDEKKEIIYCVSIYSPDPICDIEGDVILGKMRYTEQENEYYYIPPITGIYRFDYDINDVNLEYSFYLYDSKNEEKISGNFSDEGATVELIQGEKYKIKIVQYEGLPEYTIKIGIPNTPITVNNNLISGKIRYTEQKDVYYYTAPRSGLYRFDYDIDDVNKKYQCTVLNEKRKEIDSTRSEEEGLTLELVKGTLYEIQIDQIEQFPEYSVIIHVPQKEVYTSGKVLEGRIEFIDQKDVYCYTPSKTKKYCLKFITNNSDSSFAISIYNEKNEKMLDVYNTDGDKLIEMKKKHKYMVYVSYSEGYEKYKIKFE